MKTIACTLALIFVVVSSASSQSARGAVNGTVQDMFGAVIPGTEVKLARLSLEKEEIVQQTKSDAEGRYSFSNLPFGIYEVQVKAFFEKVVRKRIELTLSRPAQLNFDISPKPCSEDSDNTKAAPISNSDRLEIARELLDLMFPQSLTEKIIFVPRNIDLAWLSSEHKAKLNIMTRDKVQALAEKHNGQSYYWISSMKQTGGCVEVSMNEDIAIKGQIEDANMAGGGTIYEFRKIAGRWIGEKIGSWIS